VNRVSPCYASPLGFGALLAVTGTVLSVLG
jgi:hypothetical protein